MKKIGILGGMGPQASLKFYSLVIEKSQKDYKAEKNEDYPLLYLTNIPVKDLIKSKNDEEETKKYVQVIAESLEQAGCTQIAMTCNTMHLFQKEITQNLKIPFISMIDSVVEKVKKMKYTKIGLLGSKTTVTSSLYKTPLKTIGVKVVTPRVSDLEALSRCIHVIIAGKITKKEHTTLKKVIGYLKSKNVEGIILGCTELPLLIDTNYAGVEVFSSLDILADTVLEAYYT